MRSKGELRMTSTMAKQEGVKVEAEKRGGEEKVVNK